MLWPHEAGVGPLLCHAPRSHTPATSIFLRPLHSCQAPDPHARTRKAFKAFEIRHQTDAPELITPDAPALTPSSIVHSARPHRLLAGLSVPSMPVMPGILPMKVIKVGSNAQARIAQACDRCRTKKIRCDGIRPSCSQCLGVGFECKTSDKLSRRAFPRGYTESLEAHVRMLESVIRESKEQQGKKDEMIAMLSRMHANSAGRRPVPSAPSAVVASLGQQLPDKEDDLFRIQQSPRLLQDTRGNSCLVGTSSAFTLVDAFYRCTHSSSRSPPPVRPEAFFETGTVPPHTRDTSAVIWKAPPRLVSDQLISIFFQEWAPLFPVLHRPAVLTLYDYFVNSSEPLTDMRDLAQLNLIFGIAALAGQSPNKAFVESIEQQWQAALDTFIDEPSLVTMQCLVLAQIFSLQNADYGRLLKYKGIAVSLSHRLGLNQSQEPFALGVLTGEMRKRIFWTQYTVDCFTAAQLGLPRQLCEEDIHCEFPMDVDDEYVTEKGFLPSLPGESTKLSSALALFRVARILAKVLRESFPAAMSHDTSLRRMAAQADELDEWSHSLASHLKLQFVQDRPSISLTSSRSPVLSLAYQYIKSLIWRPALCAGIGERASAAILAVADASKATVQIMQLLEERRLCFSFCLNRHDMLVASGFGLMFQRLTLAADSMLTTDNQKLTAAIVGFLDCFQSPGSVAFRRLARLAVGAKIEQPACKHAQDGVRSTQKANTKNVVTIQSSSPNRVQAEAANDSRRATLPNLTTTHHNHTSVGISSVRSEPTLSPLSHCASVDGPPSLGSQCLSASVCTPCADSLPFDTDSHSNTPHQKPEVHSLGQWEMILGELENGDLNIYESTYGGTPVDALLDMPPVPTTSETAMFWSSSILPMEPPDQQPPPSMESFSEASLASGGTDFEYSFGSGSVDWCTGLVIPDLNPSANGIPLDGNFAA